MKKNILFYCLFLSSCAVLAQSKEISLENFYFKNLKSVSKKAIAEEDIKILENFEATNPPPTRKVQFWSYSAKAHVLAKINKKILRDTSNKTSEKSALVEKIMSNYQIALDSCVEYKYTIKINRLHFLERNHIDKLLAKKELTELKSVGYKESKKGFSIGLTLNQGKNTWIGSQVSPFSFSTGIYKIRVPDPKTGINKVVKRSDINFSAQILPIAFNYNLQQNSTEFEGSLIRFSAPIFIDITKFGFRKIQGDKTVKGFYRPEIGLGYGSFSLSYGRNFWFDKSYRPIAEKHSLQFRLIKIIGKN